MAGLPGRPALADFGPLVMEDARPVRDPDTELAAAHWNLMKHQVAGMGLLSPRIVAKLTVTTPAVLLAHAEAWNPKGLTTGQFVAPTPAYVSTGRITLTYPTVIVDELGVDVSIAFSWGFGFVTSDPPNVIKWCRVDPIVATPRILTICAFSAAGALENGNNVWIFAG